MAPGMLSMSERSIASLARRRAARRPVATRTASTSGSNGMRMTSSAPASSAVAQVVGRGEVDAHHDVEIVEVGARADGLDQARGLTRVGEHDLRLAVLDLADRGVTVVDALDAQPGGRQHLPRGIADVLEAQQQHGVALADEAVERARPSGRGACTPETA